MNIFKFTALGLLATLILGGCASGLGSRDYSRNQARSVQQVQTGVVVDVRNVNIEGTKTPIGTGGSEQDLQKFMQQELRVMTPIIKRTGISVE